MSTACLAAGPAASSAYMRVLRTVFSFPVMLAGMLMMLAVFTVRSRFDDPDMWWHLKTGEVVWTTHTVPTTDLFSYTTDHHAWTPHEWLAQVSIYAAYRWHGYTGLMLWLCTLSTVLLIAAYALCSLYSGNAKVGWVGALSVWFFATSGLAIRPQMAGYLLLILELIPLHLGRTRNPRWFFCLPPVFALWINCHGSFFLGFAVAGAFLFCSLFSRPFGLLVPASWEPQRRCMLALALALSVPALFLNPVGLKQILYPLDTLLNQPVSLSHVDEWMPLQITSARGLGLMAVLACVFLLVAVRRSEVFWHELVLLVLGTWLAVNHGRMIFVFGILAAPVLSRLLAPVWDGYNAQQDRITPNAVMIALLLLVTFWAFPSYHSLARQVDEGSPVKAVEFIKAHHLSGHMLNEYVFGGYLIWAAPEHPVFLDGRGDVFEWTGVLEDYGKWALLQSDPNALLDKFGVTFCLLSRSSPMARVLPLLHTWKAVYSDASSVVFVRSPESRTR